MNYFSDCTFIKQDKTARSLSFDGERPISFLDVKLLGELRNIGLNQEANCRISLHAKPDATLHDMIILHHRGTYNRPHYHRNKAETYHLIEGSQSVFIFDGNGGLIDRCDMSLDGVFIYRFNAGLYHMSVPTSSFVIFHETKIGPFVRDGDSIFASWAPSEAHVEESQKFLKGLMAGKNR